MLRSERPFHERDTLVRIFAAHLTALHCTATTLLESIIKVYVEVIKLRVSKERLSLNFYKSFLHESKRPDVSIVNLFDGTRQTKLSIFIGFCGLAR